MFSKMRTIAAAAIISASATAVSTPATAGTDAFIGEIMLAGFNFCPRNTMPADGQLLSIAQYSALFSLFGTYYGGDGRSTFALPDLRGRAPISQGTGPGLSPIKIGQRGGADSVTLSATNMPNHTHTATATSTLNATGTASDAGTPGGNVLSRSGSTQIYNAGPATVPMGDSSVATAVTVDPAGGSVPFSIANPYLGMNWCVVTEGIFPSRN